MKVLEKTGHFTDEEARLDFFWEGGMSTDRVGGSGAGEAGEEDSGSENLEMHCGKRQEALGDEI